LPWIGAVSEPVKLKRMSEAPVHVSVVKNRFYSGGWQSASCAAVQRFSAGHQHDIHCDDEKVYGQVLAPNCQHVCRPSRAVSRCSHMPELASPISTAVPCISRDSLGQLGQPHWRPTRVGVNSAGGQSSRTTSKDSTSFTRNQQHDTHKKLSEANSHSKPIYPEGRNEGPQQMPIPMSLPTAQDDSSITTHVDTATK
jgi:hypothetical protein